MLGITQKKLLEEGWVNDIKWEGGGYQIWPNPEGSTHIWLNPKGKMVDFYHNSKTNIMCSVYLNAQKNSLNIKCIVTMEHFSIFEGGCLDLVHPAWRMRRLTEMLEGCVSLITWHTI